MQGNARIKTVVTVIIFTFLFTLTIQAQDRPRVRPAFPIASGEKMIVIPGYVFDADVTVTAFGYILASSVDTYFYNLTLPVGSVLKRMIVEASDNDGGDASYMNFSLQRQENSTDTYINIRTVSTLGYNSSVTKQFVSNPINHAMLQGWTYYVRLTYQGSLSPSQRIGVIKIIYEP